jgi:hypothetical protein
LADGVDITPDRSNGEGPHQAVIRCLLNVDSGASSDLLRLKENRVKSDYNANASVNKSLLQSSIYLAISIEKII